MIDFNFGSYIDEVTEKLAEELRPDLQVPASQIGLDERCGSAWVVDDGIVILRRYRTRFDYYGGFEYVSSEYVSVIGDYVFYSREDSRIDECFEYLEYSENEVA